MIRVLHIGISTSAGVFGGVEKFLTDYYSHIDHNRFVFDYLLCRENSLISVEKEEYMTGSSIKALRVLKDRDNSLRDFMRLYRKVSVELQHKKYDIVHVNTSFTPVQIVCLLAARKAGIKVRIAHSHSSGRDLSGGSIKKTIKKIAYDVSRPLVRLLATDYFACSISAGIDLFGERGIASKRFKIIRNAIDADIYRFDEIIRERVRSDNGIPEGQIVFGSVGRLDPIKNIPFVLEVFRSFHKRTDKSELWIIGDGPQRGEIECLIKEYDLEQSVKMFGQRNDIAELMQGMDLLLFPSKHEGLGITAIEAQASGLTVYCSDNVPKETSITPNIHYMPVENGSDYWAELIYKGMSKFGRRDTYSAIVEAGYDVSTAVIHLQNAYLDRLYY